MSSPGRCGRMRASANHATTVTNCHVEFKSSSHVHEQFTTTVRQWRSRRCEGIFMDSWTLLAIPEKETTYITETTCRLKQSRLEEEQSREGQKQTGQRQRPLREIVPPASISTVDVIPETQPETAFCSTIP